MSKEIFAYNLKLIRRRLRLTQMQAAELAGVSHSSIGSWEEGRAYPEVGKLILLCDAYGVKDIYSMVTNRIEGMPGSPSFDELKKIAKREERMPPKIKAEINKIKKIVNAL